MANRRFGIRQLLIDGVVYLAKGGVSYSLGLDKKEEVMGVDTLHGVKITRLPAYVEVTITDGGAGFDLRKLTSLRDSTVIIDLENGKTIKLGHAFYAGEGKVTAEEGEIEAKFVTGADNAEEI